MYSNLSLIVVAVSKGVIISADGTADENLKRVVLLYWDYN